MDKRLILAVAGSGKTQLIIDRLNEIDKFLIVTYTDNNYENIRSRVTKKFNGNLPNNIYIYTYFCFLFNFCYKPFLSDKVKAKGIFYESNKNMYLKQNSLEYYLTKQKYFYSNRFSLFLEKCCIEDIRKRLEKYFNVIIFDEVQDISGRDFNLLIELLKSNNHFLMVGDFYQHTYDTSLDGNVNKSLYDSERQYIDIFSKNGIVVDTEKLCGSFRCAPKICTYIKDNLGININSNNRNDYDLYFIDSDEEILQKYNDASIIKLHYRNSSKYGPGHYNWGETKGIDSFNDVCVLLNKTTYNSYKSGKLPMLNSQTKNKLYVALTRAHGNVYLVEEEKLNKLLKSEN